MIAIDMPTHDVPNESGDDMEFVSSWTPALERKYGKELEAWAAVARTVLVEAAEAGKPITYREFYDRTAERLGVDKAPLMWRRWVSYVLEEVAHLDELHAEPLLTSLVLLVTDEEVNEPGYGHAVEIRYGFSPRKPADHARAERRKVFHYFQTRYGRYNERYQGPKNQG